MATIEKNKSIIVNGKTYSIPFPKVRQQFDIASRQSLLGNGTYGMQEKSRTVDFEFNLNLIDAVAHVAVLCPELIKDITGKQDVDVYELDLIEAKSLMDAWGQFNEWYRDIKEAVNSALLKDKEGEPKESTAK